MENGTTIKTKDTDFAAAMLSRGAELGPFERVPKGGKVDVHFVVLNVDPEAMDDYRSGRSKFSIPHFAAARKILLEIIHTP